MTCTKEIAVSVLFIEMSTFFGQKGLNDVHLRVIENSSLLFNSSGVLFGESRATLSGHAITTPPTPIMYSSIFWCKIFSLKKGGGQTSVTTVVTFFCNVAI